MINTITSYKNKACEIASNNCNKCEAMYKYNSKYYCCFDTVIRFIEWYDKEIRFIEWYDKEESLKAFYLTYND